MPLAAGILCWYAVLVGLPCVVGSPRLLGTLFVVVFVSG